MPLEDVSPITEGAYNRAANEILHAVHEAAPNQPSMQIVLICLTIIGIAKACDVSKEGAIGTAARIIDQHWEGTVRVFPGGDAHSVN